MFQNKKFRRYIDFWHTRHLTLLQRLKSWLILEKTLAELNWYHLSHWYILKVSKHQRILVTGWSPFSRTALPFIKMHKYIFYLVLLYWGLQGYSNVMQLNCWGHFIGVLYWIFALLVKNYSQFRKVSSIIGHSCSALSIILFLDWSL